MYWCECLREKLREFDPEADEELGLDEKREAQEAQRFVERITAYLVGRLAGFSDTSATKIESLFRGVGAPLDEQIEHYYVRDMLKRIPTIVNRTMKLSHIVPDKAVSGPTEVYLKEATRTYLFGFWDASVALSRAAVEQGLRHAIKERSAPNPETLRALVDEGRLLGVIDNPRKDLADKVVSAGNRVLHSEPADECEAWDVLCAARGVLLHLVSAI